MTKKIGALWKQSKDGKTYLTGMIEVVAGIQTRITVFTNDKKEKDKQPDYNIVLRELRTDDNKAASPNAEPSSNGFP